MPTKLKVSTYTVLASMESTISRYQWCQLFINMAGARMRSKSPDSSPQPCARGGTQLNAPSEVIATSASLPSARRASKEVLENGNKFLGAI